MRCSPQFGRLDYMELVAKPRLRHYLVSTAWLRQVIMLLPEDCQYRSNEVCMTYCDNDRQLCLEVTEPDLLFAALTRLQSDAKHDGLTGLWNKSAWEALAEKRILAAETQNTALGLLYIDLTNFKAVNDSLGHGVGDRLLTDFAAHITDNLRGTDIGRAGGDEFVILFDLSPHRDEKLTPAERLVGAANRLSITFEEFFKQHEFLGVTAAIGAALWEPGMNSEELINAADQAMRDSKQLQHEQYGTYRS